MKKFVALFLALVMTLSLCSVTAFATDAVPEIDLSGLTLGEGWVGKTASDVQSSLSISDTIYYTVASIRICNQNTEEDFTDAMTQNSEYLCEIKLNAKEGYEFPEDTNNSGYLDPSLINTTYEIYMEDYIAAGNSCTIYLEFEPTVPSVTIADILKTAKSVFPTSANGAWEGAAGEDNDGAKLYINDNKLHFTNESNTYDVPLDALTTIDNNAFKWESSSDGMSYCVTFNMNDGNLESVVFGGIMSMLKANLVGRYEAPESDDSSFNWETLAKGAAIAAGITVVTVGTIHTVKAIKNYKAEKAAAAEAAKLAEMPMVAMGSSGDAVTTLQTELNAQGYDCGEVDGIFGQNTLNAVMAFQTANGLAADGIVGELTWGALL